jgi:hypothetical protein
MSTRSVEQPKVPHSWIAEAVLSAASMMMVAVAAVVWARIRGQINECAGGCPDLEAVTSAIQFNGWSIIGLSAIAVVLAGFALRKTRGTDVVRGLGALALVGAMVMIVLGALVLNTSLP